jgi:hypothetical protein
METRVEKWKKDVAKAASKAPSDFKIPKGKYPVGTAYAHHEVCAFGRELVCFNLSAFATLDLCRCLMVFGVSNRQLL